jgi:hypothetical protein
MLPIGFCVIVVVGIAGIVLEHRARVCAWTRQAIASGGVSEKAIAVDLGRPAPKLSALIAHGTLQLADLLAMPAAVRDRILLAVTDHAGLITIRQYLLEELAAREQAALEAHARCKRPARGELTDIAARKGAA